MVRRDQLVRKFLGTGVAAVCLTKLSDPILLHQSWDLCLGSRLSSCQQGSFKCLSWDSNLRPPVMEEKTLPSCQFRPPYSIHSFPCGPCIRFTLRIFDGKEKDTKIVIFSLFKVLSQYNITLKTYGPFNRTLALD